MILIDLIPPGLTFRDLVGPVQGTPADSSARSQAGLRQPSCDQAGRLVRTMELITDTEFLQSYRIAEHEESVSSPAVAPPRAPERISVQAADH